MTHTEAPAYGLRGRAAINVAFFLFFAVSFVKPKTSRDWRTLGPYTAFLVALFAEMYVYPVLVFAYVRLARREEADSRLQFGAAYLVYERAVPRWLPRSARLREALRP